MLSSLGLGGDGDEVDAIERVERKFGVEFDRDRCARFSTVGDVWRALLDSLRLDEREAASIWRAFVAELAEETLAEEEYGEVGSDTKLIGGETLTEFVGRAIRRLIGR